MMHPTVAAWKAACERARGQCCAPCAAGAPCAKDTIGALSVSDTELDTLNASVTTLGMDIRAAEGPPMFTPPAAAGQAPRISPSFAAWKAFRNVEWPAFETDWIRFFRANRGILDIFESSETRSEHEALRGKYNALRVRFLSEFQGRSSAPASEASKEAPSAVDKITSATSALVVVLGVIGVAALVSAIKR